VSSRLGEILVKDGACTSDALRDALKNQVIFGGRIGTNLLEIQAVSEEAIARALGKQHALPSLSGAVHPDPHATSLLTPEIADRYDAIPYALADRQLALLVADPKDLAMLDEVSFATGRQVHPIVVPEARLWSLLRETYGIDRHLRGIDVDFSTPGPAAAPARASAPAAPGGAADLMGEAEFDALYAKASAPAAPPPEEVIDLTDLVDPGAAPARAPAPAASPALAAEVLAALSGAGGHAPPARLVRPARPEEPEPSPLGFDEALRALEGVTERDAIARTVLRHARSRFERAVLLTVHRRAAHGWAGFGAKLGPGAVRRIHLSLGSPGIVDTVVTTQAHFLGPIPKTEANIRLLRALGGGVPANALVVPILAMGRVVNVLYADGGKGGLVDAGGVGELLILATRIAKSYDALLERVR
jgi:hypothetical protein